MLVSVLVIVNLCTAAYTYFISLQIDITNRQRAIITNKIKAYAEYKAYRDRIDSNKAELAKMEQYQESVTSIEAPIFEILKTLEETVPSDISFTDVTFSEDGKITIKGMAKDEFVVADLLVVLKKNEKLADVFLNSVTKKEADNKKNSKYANVFNIECNSADLIKEKKKAPVSSNKTP